MYQPDVVPQQQFNEHGFCRDCGLDRADVSRWEDREARKVIAIVARHGICKHLILYRSLKRDWP